MQFPLLVSVKIKMAALMCIVAVLGSFLHEGHAINCYQCNSYLDPTCMQSKLPDSMLQPCGADSVMCRKLNHYVENPMEGMPADHRIVRGCGSNNSSFSGVCYSRSGYGGAQEVCSCLTDKCNSAPLPVKATVSISVPLALIKFHHIWGN